MKNYTLHVSGMHCRACPILIKSELEDIPEVDHVVVSLKKHTLVITGNFKEQSIEMLADELSKPLLVHGYRLSPERKKHTVNWADFRIALPVGMAFIVLFIFLQKLGVVNLVSGNNMTYGTAFFIGLIASISTCMAVVGGLVLSISANYAKAGDQVVPQTFFHLSRLATFFLLGGVMGIFGSFFVLSETMSLALGVFIALVLLILGINLLDMFPPLKYWLPTLPDSWSERVRKYKNRNQYLTPVFLGALTFFLPCGFTQSMQLFALSTGTFIEGSLTMGAFALGTLPVLLALSFSSFVIQKKSQSGIFFKVAGIIVIFFGIINLLGSLSGAGIISPLLNF